ncbi:MAG: PIN domain-containing protein [Desulfurellaceae bacterium]|nr:PIN domain-containing protein [Desulfurellaceae bacterium]
MSVAYVDTSALVSIAFNERGGTSQARRLDNFSHLLSSNLLEAELRAVFAREEIDFTTSLVSGIEWVLPDRPLTPELKTALEAGYLRGADLWHVATALYVVQKPSDISFVTLDIRQRTVVKALGFQA